MLNSILLLGMPGGFEWMIIFTIILLFFLAPVIILGFVLFKLLRKRKAKNKI